MDKYQRGFATLPVILLVLLVIGVGTYVGLSDKTATTDSTDSGEIFCTQEAMQCPDGSYVGRTGPNCEFAACPGAPTTKTPLGNSVACSQEAKQCSDGSYVTRTGPNCTFAQCPGTPAPKPPADTIFCSQEAKQCSDGSYVTRTGPNCEFAQCPR